VLQKEDSDWVKKYIEYEVEGSRPLGRPRRTWREVIARTINFDSLIDWLVDWLIYLFIYLLIN